MFRNQGASSQQSAVPHGSTLLGGSMYEISSTLAARRVRRNSLGTNPYRVAFGLRSLRSAARSIQIPLERKRATGAWSEP